MAQSEITWRYIVVVILIVAALFVAVFNAPMRPGRVEQNGPAVSHEATGGGEEDRKSPASSEQQQQQQQQQSSKSSKAAKADDGRDAPITTAVGEEHSKQPESPAPADNSHDRVVHHYGFEPTSLYLTNWLANSSEVTDIGHRVAKAPMALALRQFNKISFNEIRDNKDMDVLCTLVVMQTRNCDPFKDSLAECVARFGFESWQKLLGEKCIHSSFWGVKLRQIIAADPKLAEQAAQHKSHDANEWKKMNRGVIWSSQIWKPGDTTPHVPPAQRTYSPFPGVRKCGSGCVHYPIAFGIPLSYFVEKVPRTKSFQWMPLMPKHTPARGSYDASIEDEDVFREMYSQSYFAWTHSRAGWDCMRHYEIFAAGTVPFFYDIERCPRNTLGHLPKALLRRVTHMEGLKHIFENGARYVHPNMFGGVNFNRLGDINAPRFNMTEYYEVADELLDYGRKYLTTRAVASYLLKTLDAENAKRVLLVSRGPYDYLEITLIHGLQDLGIQLTVASDSKDYLYKMRTPDGTATRAERDNILKPIYLSTYGAAYGYAMRLGDTVNRPFVSHDDQNSVVKPIKNGEFDVVLYAVTGNYKHLDAVKKTKAKLAFLQFGDMHGDPSPATMQACQHGPVFVREMTDKSC